MANQAKRELHPLERLPTAVVSEGNVESITQWQQTVEVRTVMVDPSAPTEAELAKQQEHIKAAQVKMASLEPRGEDGGRGITDRDVAVRTAGRVSRGNITTRS